MKTIWNDTRYRTGIFEIGGKGRDKAKLKEQRRRADMRALVGRLPVRRLFIIIKKLDTGQFLSKKEKEWWTWLRGENIVKERPLLPEFRPRAILRKKEGVVVGQAT